MNRLKELRVEKGLLQSDIAKVVNKSDRAIGLYERGERDMGTETLTLLSNFFNVSIDYLLGKSDIRNPEKNIDFDPSKLYIGLSAKDYENITETQMKQIEELAKVVLKDNLKNNNDKKD